MSKTRLIQELLEVSFYAEDADTQVRADELLDEANDVEDVAQWANEVEDFVYRQARVIA